MSGGAVSGNTASSSYSSGGGVYVVDGIFTMSGGAVSGNTASSSSSYSSGGGVYVYGTFTMSGGAVSGNILSGTYSYGREVLVNGTFRMSGDAWPERVFLYNNTQSITISGPLSGPVTLIDLGITSYSSPLTSYIYVPILKLDNAYSSGDMASLKTYFNLGYSKWIDSPYTEAALTGYGISDGGLVTPPPSTITNITYSDVFGGTWTLESDGRRKSPPINDSGITKSRVNFTSGTDAVITIQLDVSSEPGLGYAFISTLDNPSATYSSGYYTGSRISGTTSVTVSIPVPTAGDHFIDIGYESGSGTGGSDCAWFRLIE
jgi:hypothetical protein